MRTTRIDQGVCPHCEARLTASSSVDDVSPEPGDLTLCGYCLKTLQFDVYMRVRPVSDDEIEPELVSVLEQIATRIRQSRS